MNKLIGFLILSMLTVPAIAAEEQANQDVNISKSGVIIVKSQRQQKTANTNQSIKIDKSGGIFVIFQRNINKYKCDDIKKLLEGTN